MKYVWIIVSLFDCGVVGVFKNKKLALEWMKGNNLKKIKGFYATDKESIEDSYCYTLEKYRVR